MGHRPQTTASRNLGRSRENLELSSPFDSDSTTLEDTTDSVSLTMNGGAQVPAGGGEISLWCRGDGGGQWGYGQVMIIRLDGFF